MRWGSGETVCSEQTLEVHMRAAGGALKPLSSGTGERDHGAGRQLPFPSTHCSEGSVTPELPAPICWIEDGRVAQQLWV